MAAGKLEIKARIRSVESTKKITKAMQLVATSKLKKQKQYMEENRDYAYYLKETAAPSPAPKSRCPYKDRAPYNDGFPPQLSTPHQRPSPRRRPTPQSEKKAS